MGIFRGWPLRIPLARFGFILVLASSLAGRSACADDAPDAPIFGNGFEDGTSCAWSAISFPGDCRYDFWCAGDPAPTSSADPLNLSGTLTDFESLAAIQGATVEGRRVSNSSLLGTDTTAADGSFNLIVATGGIPLDAYFLFTATTYPATALFLADPLAADAPDLDARAVSSSRLAVFYSLALATGPDSGKGTAMIQVVDCVGTPIQGALLQVNPVPGKIAYMSSGLPNPNATFTDSTGIAMAFNSPSGVTTLGATLAGRPLESHGIAVLNQGLSLTIVHP